MKKQFLTAVVVLFSAVTFAQTTPEKKETNFELIINGKLGFARLRGSDFIPLNGNVNGSDLMLAYKFDPRWSIATGVGILQFSANTAVAGNSVSLTNNYLQIPFRINGDYNIFKGSEPKDSKIFFNLSGGFYANTLVRQEVQTVTEVSRNNNLGWNFGFSTSVGVKFIVTDVLNLGLGIESQNEFTKMKKNGSDQRIDQMNTIYFRMGLTL